MLDTPIREAGQSNGTALIRLQGVSQGFSTLKGDPVHGVKSVIFQINPAEFVALVGPSGCGKSTVLRMIAGLIPQTGGRVLVRGKEVVGPLKGETGIVFQQPLLFPFLTL